MMGGEGHSFVSKVQPSFLMFAERNFWVSLRQFSVGCPSCVRTRSE